MSTNSNDEERELQETLAELRALPRPAMDFTTPEGAILCLEDAYRRRDIEAVLACKDFEVEAVLLLLQTMPENVSDPEIIAETAKVLELGYRKEISENWPDMEGIESFFVDREPGFQDLSIVVVTEVSLMPDGTLSQTRMQVSKRETEGWKVLVPVSEDNPKTRRYESVSPDSDLPVIQGQFRAPLLRHIETYWGEPELLFEDAAPDYVQVQVYWIKATRDRPFHTLITSGMSDRPMTVPEGAEENQFAELLISLPADWPLDEKSLKKESFGWPVQWLKQLARFPHEYGTWLFCGHTVPNGDPAAPFAPNTQLCCMLLASPVLSEEDGGSLVIDTETTVHLHSLIPIYREEMEFALEQSSDELLERLGDADASELLDLKRQNVCLE